MRFLPKLHITWKLLAEAEGFDKNNYNTYHTDWDYGGLLRKIYNKPYLTQNKIKTKKELDAVLEKKEFTTPAHLINNLQFILTDLNEDENKIRIFFADEENRKKVISSLHCKLFLSEKILSTKDETEKKIYEITIGLINRDEFDAIERIYEEFLK